MLTAGAKYVATPTASYSASINFKGVLSQYDFLTQ